MKTPAFSASAVRDGTNLEAQINNATATRWKERMLKRSARESLEKQREQELNAVKLARLSGLREEDWAIDGVTLDADEFRGLTRVLKQMAYRQLVWIDAAKFLVDTGKLLTPHQARAFYMVVRSSLSPLTRQSNYRLCILFAFCVSSSTMS